MIISKKKFEHRINEAVDKIRAEDERRKWLDRRIEDIERWIGDLERRIRHLESVGANKPEVDATCVKSR